MVLHGVITNLNFLQAVMAHTDFQAGSVTTRWVESVLDDLTRPVDLPLDVLIAAALMENKLPPTNKPPDLDQTAAAQGTDPYSPWRLQNGFRLGENS
jgi:acetyl/propionyl-CoA carboxylase alpha subunit